MTRHELKIYLRYLKQLEAEKVVTISSAKKLESAEHHKFAKMFPGKKINYTLDPQLLVGVKVTGSDFSYELSLEKNLENVLAHLSSI